MKNQVPTSARNCCTLENQRLVEAIRACDYCSTSFKRHLACYRRAAKESGQRSHSCMIL